jgi:hypothetical protein
MKKIAAFTMVYFLSMFCIYAQSGEGSFKFVSITKVPKPTGPVHLEISDIDFFDNSGNGNKILDANESGEISFTLKNTGKGDAYQTSVSIVITKEISGLLFKSKINIGDINSGEIKKVTIPVSGNMDLETSDNVTFTININEANKFNPAPIKFLFKTQAFKNPILDITDYTFSNKEKEGKVTLGEVVNLNLIVQNIGQGLANDVSVSITNPENVFPANSTIYSFKTIKPNESKKINYQFFANTAYDQKEIPIQVKVTETNGKYGTEKKMTISLEQNLAKTLQVEVDAQREANVAISKVSLTSDVDRNIPTTSKKYNNRYALIIGNEDYSSNQKGLEVEANVEFASNDAKTFKEYCIKTMGVPEENITLVIDGTSGKMNQAIEKMNKLTKNSNGELEVIFYYAGHGFPDEQSKEAYLIPVDVTGTDLQSAIKLKTLYSRLNEFPCKRVTVFLDACFTGGGRNQGLMAARGIKVKPQSDLIIGKMVVFTASSGTESSMPWKEKQHGLFTYTLLKHIQDSKGEINYDVLFTSLSSEIRLKSVNINNKEQTPQILISNELGESWKKWTIN